MSTSVSDLSTKWSEWGLSARGISLRIDPTEKEFNNLYNGTLLSLDVEDDETGKYVGVGVYDGNTCFYFSKPVEWAIHSVFTKPFVAHNGKSDLHKLKKWGVKANSSQLAFDTMVASCVIDSTRDSHGLKKLVGELFEIKYPTYKEMVGKGPKKLTLDKQPVELVAQYNGMDCFVTRKLWKHFEESFSGAQHQYFEEIEMPVFRILWEMEALGIKLDVPRLMKLDNKLGIFKIEIEKRLRASFGPINLNSPKQLIQAFGALNIHLKSTDVETLEEHSNLPLISDLLAYRGLAKLKGTYTEPMLQMNGEVHAEFMADTGTGRFSCKNPNLQNQPSHSDLGLEMRECFVAREGHVYVLVDYSQIELRVLAHLSGDRRMTQAFLDDEDIHQVTATEIEAARDIGKTINFATVYGSGAYNLHLKTGIPLTAAETFMKKFEHKFSGVYDWKKTTIYAAQRSGSVKTLLGRVVKRYLTANCKKHARKIVNRGIPCSSDCRKRLDAEADRRVISAAVQGSAADIIKKAMVQLQEAGFRSLIQEHDALLFEIPREANTDTAWGSSIESACHTIDKIMTSVVKLSVPLKADISIGDSWGQCKKA